MSMRLVGSDAELRRALEHNLQIGETKVPPELVEDLRQMLRRVCLHYLGTKVFEERARYAGEEVQVCWAVEAAREVGRDGLEVLRRGLDEIYDWNLYKSASLCGWERPPDTYIRDHMPCCSNVQMYCDLVWCSA